MNHTSPLDLSAALLTAETSGQLPPDAQNEVPANA